MDVITKIFVSVAVIPEKPTDLVLINKTINSAVIRWDIPYPLYNFPPGLQFKIEYKSKWDPVNVWNVSF